MKPRGLIHKVARETLEHPVLEHKAAGGFPPGAEDLATDQRKRPDRHLRLGVICRDQPPPYIIGQICHHVRMLSAPLSKYH